MTLLIAIGIIGLIAAIAQLLISGPGFIDHEVDQ